MHGLNGSGRAAAQATLEYYCDRHYTELPSRGPLQRRTWGESTNRLSLSEVQQFNSPDIGIKIVVCVCIYQPIEAQWQELRRGAPITAESLAGVAR